MAKIFLPLLAMIKLFFGLMHVILRSNSKEITKLLVTMIFLSGMVLHSNLNSEATFKDVYFAKDTDKPTNHWAFITEYVPALDTLISSIPSILDSNNVAAGMTANVATSSINSINLVAYHWLIIIGVVSGICCHMIAYTDYSQIGRMGLSVFYVLFGICIMVLDELQRAFVHVLSADLHIIDMSHMNQSALARTVLILAFVCCASGASLFAGGKFKKLGIFVCVIYIGVLTYYEVQCLLIGQRKRDQTEITKGNMNVDLNAMLKYHDQYIYPTDYQLLRILNLMMVLSGTLFEMLKIFMPENAVQSQADYSSVDEDDQQEEVVADTKQSGKGKGKKKKKQESKKKK